MPESGCYKCERGPPTHWEPAPRRGGGSLKLEEPKFLSQSSRLDSVAFFFLCVFLGLHLRHMKVPRLGVESELYPLTYTTATETLDLSRICDPHHNSWQRWILNPLSEAGDRTRNLMVPSQICFYCTTMGTPMLCLLYQPL